MTLPGNRFFIALLLSAFATAAGGADAPASANPADEIARRFAAAINSDDEAKRRENLVAIFSPATLESVGIEKVSAQVASVRERFGTIELHHGEFSARPGGPPTALHVFARATKTGEWQDFQFRLDDAVPPRATQLIFIAQVTEPIALPNGDIASPDTLAWLDGYVERLAREDDFSGAILVARGDKVMFERTVGVADAAAKTKNGSATRFNMASGGKMFTAIGIAKLVEAGKLGWDTPLLDAVDGFPDSPRARRVTIHHLLSHTSGIAEYWTPDFEKERPRIASLSGMLPWVLRVGFAADPGADVAYSNSNFILAGLAIEKASGMSFDEFAAKTIFEPLGMASTGYPLTTGSGLAEPIVRQGTEWVTATQGLRGSSAGGSYSTPRDMLRFVRGLLAGKVIRRETLTVLTTSKTSGFRESFGYGYGFAVNAYQGTTSFGHGGITKGVDFDLEYFPREDITLVVFGNRGAPAFDTLRKNVTRLITGER